MVSTPGDAARLAPLDGLRGIAVTVVFLMHTLALPKGGGLGVDIFFALSGFLITSLLWRELQARGTIAATAFYKRRCLRLLPAFAAMCLLYAALHQLFPRTVAVVDVGRLFALLLNSNLYWASGAHPVPLLQHTWSLAVEWQFYLLWPLVLTLAFELGLRRRGLLLLMLIAVVAIWFVRWRGDMFWRIDGILLGAMLPLMREEPRVQRLFAARHALGPLCLVPGVALLWFLAGRSTLSAVTAGGPVSLLSASIILFVLCNPQASITQMLSAPLLQHLGRISYGLYLYHFPIAALMYVNGFTPQQLLLAGLFVAWPLAEVSWRCLESPLLRWQAAAALPAPSPAVPGERHA